MINNQQPAILYEDTDILVLDKPAGIIVNNADTTKGVKTVQDWVESKIKNQRSKIKNNEESDFYKRAGIVHRLDKETSGILLVAKTNQAFLKLQAQFKERTVKKMYTALVHGKIDIRIGEIRVPVGRLPWNRKQFGVVAGGREAITKYKVLRIAYYVLGSKKEFLSLLELYPETGRTHQIRVHLKYIGHPIFADFLYGGRKTSREDRQYLPRVFLHASKISFTHPTTGKQMHFESPLPKELTEFLRNLS